MGVRGTRRWAASACLLALLVAAGCTPGGDPHPTSTPAVTSATPTETAQEREERLAYAAAEKNYRAFRAEYNRVLAEGGEAKPTNTMTRTAGGPYLKELQAGSSAYKGLHHFSRGSEKIVYVRPDGFSPSELVMNICEDSRSVITYDKAGKRLYSGDLRLLNLVFRMDAGQWKAWTGSGKKVSECP